MAELEQRLQRLELLLENNLAARVSEDVAGIQYQLKMVQDRLLTVEKQLAMDLPPKEEDESQEHEVKVEEPVQAMEMARHSKNRKSVVSEARLQHSLQDSFWDAPISSLGIIFCCIKPIKDIFFIKVLRGV